MENRKPLNFAQALRAKPGTATTESTSADSQLSTNAASQLATEQASQIPPTSLLSTTPPEMAIRQAPKRAVDSRKKAKVDSRKGDRHRGDKVPFNNRLSSETVSRIKHFCVDHGIELQEFAELSAIHFMDSWIAKSRKVLAG